MENVEIRGAELIGQVKQYTSIHEGIQENWFTLITFALDLEKIQYLAFLF